MHRAFFLLALVVGLAVVAAPSSAKEGGQVRILTPIPREAAPGTYVPVGWTLTAVEEDRRIPYGASGVFVRLFGPENARTPRAYAMELEPGRFRARARVPRGGVRRVVIGLMGTSCSAGGCQPSPHRFRIVGRVFR
jgi:hypothetical protein